jgi:hypothetical protein
MTIFVFVVHQPHYMLQLSKFEKFHAMGSMLTISLSTLLLTIFLLGACTPTTHTTSAVTTSARTPTAGFSDATSTPSVLNQLEFVLNTRLPSAPPMVLPSEDLSIIASNQHRLQITRLRYTDRIVNEVAANGAVFLVVEAFVYNYSPNDHTYSQLDFVITAGGTSNPPSYLVDVNRTAALQSLDFPFHFAAPNFIVPSRRVRQVVMVFYLDQHLDAMRFHYFGDTPRPFLEFFVMEESDGSINAVKYLEGRRQGTERAEVPLFSSPVFTLDTQEVARLHDYQEWPFYNCDGAGQMKQTISYEFESFDYVRNLLEINFNVAATGLPSRLLGLLQADINAQRDAIFTQSMKEMRSVEITVPSRTNSLYRTELYFVNQTGIMEITLGGQTFRLPYTLENRPRFHIRSIPTEPCS